MQCLWKSGESARGAIAIVVRRRESRCKRRFGELGRQQHETSHNGGDLGRMGRDQESTQMFVMAAMGLVTGAIAVGMYRHGGFPGPVAATAALALCG